MKLRNWVKFPSSWIRQGQLKEFRGSEGAALLKMMLALETIRGHYEQRTRKSAPTFPATIRELTDTAHVNRTRAVSLASTLEVMGFIERQAGGNLNLGVDPRTTTYSFKTPDQPFFPFPYKKFQDSEILAHLRGDSRVALATLKVYLLIGTFRDNSSGRTRLSYDGFARHGQFQRGLIRSALSMLIEHGLVHVIPSPNEQQQSNQYWMTGLGFLQKQATDGSPEEQASSESREPEEPGVTQMTVP